MTRRLEAQDLAGATLSLNPIGESSFLVETCGIIVGEIIARRRSFGRVVWFWSLSGPNLPQAMPGAGSNATTLQGAKTALKTSLDNWLHAATGKHGDISWS